MTIFRYVKASQFFPKYAPSVKQYRNKLCGTDGRQSVSFTDDDKKEIKKGFIELFKMIGVQQELPKKNKVGKKIQISGSGNSMDILEDYLDYDGYLNIKRLDSGDVIVIYDSNKKAKKALQAVSNRLKKECLSHSISADGLVLKYKSSLATII